MSTFRQSIITTSPNVSGIIGLKYFTMTAKICMFVENNPSQFVIIVTWLLMYGAWFELYYRHYSLIIRNLSVVEEISKSVFGRTGFHNK